MKDKYRDPTLSPYRPRDIMAHMQKNYGVDVKYKKAWRSKEKALELLYGTDKESFANLPSLKFMIEQTNPGSSLDIVTTVRARYFKNFFMSLSAWKRGWKWCRPVIIVDGTFLKNYFKGTLFSACAMDANEQIFPLAFGVGDSETTSGWVYFLTKLREAIGEREHQVIVSDRNKGIKRAVEKVFTHSEHGYCMFHLLQNVRNKFKELTKQAKWKFFGAANAYTVVEWEKFMVMLDEENPAIRAYLLDVGPAKWARSHFSEKRYSIMTSNNAESLNAVFLKAREFPISKIVDFLRERMTKWFFERRQRATETVTHLSVKAHLKLVGYIAEASGMQVLIQ